MNRLWVLAFFAVVSSGCSFFAPARKGPVKGPDVTSTQLLVPSVEAGAAIAAAAALREMVRTNPYPDLFWGCSSPEQGLDVAVYKDSTSGLYYVVLSQHFNRCGGPRVRVLDGWYEYAVTAQGEIVGEVLPMDEEEPPPAPLSVPPTSHPEKSPSSDVPPESPVESHEPSSEQ
ncbi:hypothetical protein [Melittangium boletus]|uniref:hypothetical protein n=1 Tax=Melittangium boletus TaxID=83453 RepID=UPI003DA25DF3